jgi:hypothetical protein
VAAAPAGNDDVDVPIVEMRVNNIVTRRLAWSGPVRRPKILLRGSRCWLGAVLKPASIEPLQSVIDYGNRCSWGRLRCTHSLILNELGPGPARRELCIKDGRNRPWTRLADSPKQVNATNSPTPHHPVENPLLYHCDQYEAHASYGGGTSAIEAGIKIGEPDRPGRPVYLRPVQEPLPPHITKRIT